ncbi:PREDICTED: uncharacterized protein LOC104592979 [Nelumbo nucifera]|uniref:Uncharacterized protein LOC104592979 n=2 Tax=Nelumbo nucifera TaxID=4432 RepID=A0A1U7ZDL4_NELNU|nr:PREDICTED: uncharacterized protein LOC104592979 [Nelumbo nucifera]DAD36059.1 TPA_asm: hypothetical protein HUJ06_006699 [Nelumbo nucifera]
MKMTMTMTMPLNHSSNHNHEKNQTRSLSRTRIRRWRKGHTGTAVVAVVALLISTTAWLSLVFSGTTTRCWHHFKDWEGSPHHSFPWHKHYHSNALSSHSSHPPPPSIKTPIRRNTSTATMVATAKEELSLKHIVFGIAGSKQLWKRRKEFVKLWWRPKDMRGHVWLEENFGNDHDDNNGDGDDDSSSLPPIMVSEDISRFRYTNPTGHPSGLRIARIIMESFRLGLSDVRWFVLGDDDTIFNPDNLVDVLNKYDSSEMVYIGSPSESHSANTYFSHSMAFGGGGIAISYPLAEALSNNLDECLERYPKLYGSDDRLHACITEIGVPLTREHGFHQWDIRGNAHGLLSAHPIAPFISIHHVEAVDPFYSGMSSLEGLKLFTRAMRADPRVFLQRSICYDRIRRLTFSVSLGYVVQVFPNIVLPRELERSEQTYSAWNRISHRNEFDFDTRDVHGSVCKKPILFFLKDVWKDGNATMATYRRTNGSDDLKRKVFCFPRSLPLPRVQNIQVLGYPLSKTWHLMPRRLCCKVNQTTDQFLRLTVRQCERGYSGFLDESV